MTLTVNATVVTIDDDPATNSTVVTLEADVNDSWTQSYKNSFNEWSEVPVQGIISNTEGRVTHATLTLVVENQDGSALDLAIGDHKSFSLHFDRRPIVDDSQVQTETTSAETVTNSDGEISATEVSQVADTSTDQTTSDATDQVLSEETVNSDAASTQDVSTETAPPETVNPNFTGQIADSGDVIQTSTETTTNGDDPNADATTTETTNSDSVVSEAPQAEAPQTEGTIEAQ